MLSIEKIRQDPDAVRSALARRGESPNIDHILSLDEERRGIIVEGDSLRATRNEVSRKIGQMSGDRSELVEQMRDVARVPVQA